MDEMSVVLTALCQSCHLHTAFYSNPNLNSGDTNCRYCGKPQLVLTEVQIFISEDLYRGLIWGDFQRTAKEPKWIITSRANTTTK